MEKWDSYTKYREKMGGEYGRQLYHRGELSEPWIISFVLWKRRKGIIPRLEKFAGVPKNNYRKKKDFRYGF